MTGCDHGSVSIVRRFDSPKIQLKLKLALTLTLTLTDTGDLQTIERSDYRADTVITWSSRNVCVCVLISQSDCQELCHVEQRGRRSVSLDHVTACTAD